MELTETQYKLFWSKVNKYGVKINPQLNHCWEWTGWKSPDGYGGFSLYTEWKEQITFRAHRVSWEMANGQIPEDLVVCHKCDNRKCVNPGHLFLGTVKDNWLDGVAKGRINPRNLPPAERKIFSHNEQRIVEGCEKGESHESMAKELGVCRELVSRYARQHGYHRNLIQEEKEEVLRLSQLGFSNKQIGDSLGREQSTIRKFLNRHGKKD